MFAVFNNPTKYFNITLVSLLMLHMDFNINAGSCCNSCKGGTNKTSTEVNPPKKTTHGNPPKKNVTKNSTDNEDSNNEANEEKIFKDNSLLWLYKRKYEALLYKGKEAELTIKEEDIRNATKDEDIAKIIKKLNNIEIHTDPFKNITLDPDNINLNEKYLYNESKSTKMKSIQFIQLINDDKVTNNKKEDKLIFEKLMSEGKLFNLLKLTPNTFSKLYSYEDDIYKLYVYKDTLTLENYIKLGEISVSDIRKNIDIYTDSYILFSKSHLEDKDIVTVFKKPIIIDLDKLPEYKNIVWYDNKETDDGVSNTLNNYYSNHGGDVDLNNSMIDATRTFEDWLYTNRGEAPYGRCRSINYKDLNFCMYIIFPPSEEFIKHTKIKGYKRIWQGDEEFKKANKDEMVEINIFYQDGGWTFYYIKE